eukprot:1050675-Amphidinium_carterae.1
MRGVLDSGPVIELQARQTFTAEKFKRYALAMAPRERGKVGSLTYDFWKQYVVDERCWPNRKTLRKSNQNFDCFKLDDRDHEGNFNCTRRKQWEDIQPL